MKNKFDKLFENHYGLSQKDLLGLESLCSLIEEQMQKMPLKEVKADEDAVAYKNKRWDEYASVGDQLDMKYHDLLDGTTTWKDHVEGIKTKYPKP